MNLLDGAADEVTLNEQAHRRLEELIVTLELAPGSVVSESILSSLIGIGTTPIREALQRLSREYLVRIFPRRGVVITAIDVQQQLQVLETRRELDRLIARLAARRASTSERQGIALLADRFDVIGPGNDDLKAFLRLDAEMNSLVARAAHNDIAADAVLSLHSLTRRFWFFHHHDRLSGQSTAVLHSALARAVASGDEDSAVRACDVLIDEGVAFAKRTLPG